MPVIWFNEKFIFFGREAVIASFDLRTREWSQIGSTTNKARNHHNAIQLPDDSFLVFGGTGQFVTKRCTWNDDQLECTAQTPSVKDYTAWPEMFYVTEDFCQ